MDDGYRGPDVELFFAVLDVLRRSRNDGTHITVGLPPVEVEKKKRWSDTRMADFNEIANTHRRPLW